MAFISSLPLPAIMLTEVEGSLVYSEVYSPYLSNTDTPIYEVVYLTENDASSGEAFSSTGASISDQIEGILRYFRSLGANIVSPNEVRDYLDRYPEIIEISRNVFDAVYQYFDFKAQLSLEIEDDEVPNSEYLVMYIRLPEYDNSVMDRIREIRDSYYALLDNTTGWFLLTTDFGSPRQ